MDTYQLTETYCARIVSRFFCKLAKPRSGSAMNLQKRSGIACARHPKQETSLKCYHCDDAICFHCAKRTDVGYLCPRCKEALKGRFYTASLGHYLLVTIIVGTLSTIAGAVVIGLAVAIPFVIIFAMLHLGRFSGRHIGRLAFKAVQGKRGKHMAKLAGFCFVTGTAMAVLAGWLITFSWWTPFIGILYLIGAYQELIWQVD